MGHGKVVYGGGPSKNPNFIAIPASGLRAAYLFFPDFAGNLTPGYLAYLFLRPGFRNCPRMRPRAAVGGGPWTSLRTVWSPGGSCACCIINLGGVMPFRPEWNKALRRPGARHLKQPTLVLGTAPNHYPLWQPSCIGRQCVNY